MKIHNHQIRAIAMQVANCFGYIMDDARLVLEKYLLVQTRDLRVIFKDNNVCHGSLHVEYSTDCPGEHATNEIASCMVNLIVSPFFDAVNATYVLASGESVRQALVAVCAASG